MKIITTLIMLLAGFSVAHAETIDRIVAKVGGDVITMSEVTQNITQKKSYYLQRYGKDQGMVAFEKFKRDALNEMILMSILNDQIKKEGLSLSEKELAEEYHQRLRQSGISEKTLIERLADNGVTLREFKNNIKEEIERTRFIQKKIMPHIAVSDFDLQKEYEAHIQDYQVYAKLKFIEVFLTLDRFDSREGMNALARQIQSRLKSGQDVSGLIRQHSSGAFANKGGDSGVVEADQLRPEIQSVLSTLETGQTSEVIPVQDGLFIFKLLSKSDPKPIPFDKVVGQIRSRFSERSVEDELRKYLVSIKDQTYVEIL